MKKPSFKKDNFIFLLNRMSSVCHLYVIRMSLVHTRMSSVCHSYVARKQFYHEPYQIPNSVLTPLKLKIKHSQLIK